MKTLTYIITNYLYISKNIFIESQRITEKWFKKQKLSDEWNEYKDILLDKEKLYTYMVENDLQFKYDFHSSFKYTNNCEYCGNKTIFKSLKWGFKKYCCNTCAVKNTLNLEKQKETMIKKYGVDNALKLEKTKILCQTKEAKEKRVASVKITSLERYGVECVLSLKEFRNDHKRDYDDIVRKFKITNIERYGVECPLHRKERREYFISNGLWISDEDLPDYEFYKRVVWKITNKQNIKTLDNINKRGRNSYHLDHRYSIFEGFKNNIPAYIIGNICNLEMIEESENIRKGSKCSITLDELCLNIFSS